MNQDSASTAQPVLQPPITLTDHTRLAFLLAGVLLGVTAFRLWFATRVGLVPDEAYYWVWSKHLAASYRDKGPGVAWTIALGTKLFGDTVFGVRFFAVMLSTATGWAIFSLARRLYGERSAWLSLLVALLMPMLAVGSILMTIDSLSVFAWAWATVVFWIALETRQTWHWIGLGLIIGFGFLAKFTNGLQLACIALFLCWSKPHRSLLFSRQSMLMWVAFVVSILPIVIWNMQTGWIHLSALHSRSGVTDSFQIRPLELIKFLAGEAAVLSPLLAAGMAIAGIGLLWKGREEMRTQFLLSQFLPVFGIFLFFSVNRAGKENWPAPALVAGIVLMVAFWSEVVQRRPRWRWAAWSALGVAFLMTAVLHNTDFLRLSPKMEPMRRAQGWPDFADHVQRARTRYHSDLLLGGHYSQASIMQFYLPDHPETFLPKQPYGENQFTLWPDYKFSADSSVLFVAEARHHIPDTLLRDFPDCQEVDDFWSQHRGRPMTHFKIYLCKPLPKEIETGPAGRDSSGKKVHTSESA